MSKNQRPLSNIMSGTATTLSNAKRLRNNDNEDINGGSAAIGDSATKPNAGTSKQVSTTKSVIQAALESQKLGIVSLPSISLHFKYDRLSEQPKCT